MIRKPLSLNSATYNVIAYKNVDDIKERNKVHISQIFEQEYYIHKRIAKKILDVMSEYSNFYLYRCMLECYNYGLDSYNCELFLLNFKHLCKQINFVPSIEFDESDIERQQTESTDNTFFSNNQVINQINSEVNIEEDQSEEVNNVVEEKPMIGEQNICNFKAIKSKRALKTQRYKENKKKRDIKSKIDKITEDQENTTKSTHSLSEYITQYIPRQHIYTNVRRFALNTKYLGDMINNTSKYVGNQYFNDFQILINTLFEMRITKLINNTVLNFNIAMSKLVISLFSMLLCIVSLIYGFTSAVFEIISKLFTIPIRVMCCFLRCTVKKMSKEQAKKLFANTIEGQKLQNKLKSTRKQFYTSSQYEMYEKDRILHNEMSLAINDDGSFKTNTVFSSNYEDYYNSKVYQINRMTTLKNKAINLIQNKDYYDKIKQERGLLGSVNYILSTINLLLFIIRIVVVSGIIYLFRNITLPLVLITAFYAIVARLRSKRIRYILYVVAQIIISSYLFVKYREYIITSLVSFVIQHI